MTGEIFTVWDAADVIQVLGHVPCMCEVQGLIPNTYFFNITGSGVRLISRDGYDPHSNKKQLKVKYDFHVADVRFLVASLSLQSQM